MKLYKYKSVNSKKELKHVLEIIEDKKIYLPRFRQLNDPFESFTHRVYLSVCGESIRHSSGNRNCAVDEAYENFGILSLTNDCQNQVMWAMYGNQYRGVCLCFELPDKARKIKYLSTKQIRKLPDITDENFSEDILKESLFYKNKLWKYEKEYRIISKEKYLKIKNENLKYVIIGEEILEKYRKEIEEKCIVNNIKFYKPYIHYMDNEIYIKEYNFVPKYNGSDVITNDI